MIHTLKSIGRKDFFRNINYKTKTTQDTAQISPSLTHHKTNSACLNSYNKGLLLKDFPWRYKLKLHNQISYFLPTG